MKIAYLSTFYPYRGGIAQFNAALYREFEKSHQIEAFTFLRQYPEILFPGSTQMVGDDDRADKIEAQRILDTINPIGYYRSAMKINKYAPDLLITKFWMPFFAPSLGTVAKYLSKNTIKISILDNVIPHEKRTGDIPLIKYFLGNNDAFVVMSETVQNDLLELKPDAKFINHIHPLYNHFGEKVDTKFARDRLNLPFDKKVLLFFGFIRDYKGLDILLEAMKELPDDYHLLIAGEVYGEFDKYDRIIERLQIQDKVTKHVRYISDDEVSLCFSASDLCVLPYRSATQSGITAIAYHFDLPIVANNVGSLKEMIEPNQTGYLVEKPDPLLLKNAIIEVFSQPLLGTYKENIHKYKSIASWSSLSKSINDFYYDLYNERDLDIKKKNIIM